MVGVLFLVAGSVFLAIGYCIGCDVTMSRLNKQGRLRPPRTNKPALSDEALHPFLRGLPGTPLRVLDGILNEYRLSAEQMRRVAATFKPESRASVFEHLGYADALVEEARQLQSVHEERVLDAAINDRGN